MSRRGWLLFAAMAVIWGVPYLLIKVAVDAMHPSVVVFLRTVIGAALLLPIAGVRGQLRPALRAWRPLLLFTFVEITAPWLLLTEAERKVTSSFAGLLVAVVPLVGAVLALLGGSTDRLSRGRLVGLLVGFAGLAALLGIDLHGAHGQTLATIFILLVAVGYALGPMVVARALSDVPPMGVIALALGINAVVYLPFAIHDAPSRTPSGEVIWSIVGLGVLCTAAAFVLFFALIAEVGPQRATVITYLNPAVAILLGVTVRGEKFTAGMAIGFPLVLLGCWLATGRRSAPQAVPEAPVAALEATYSGAVRGRDEELT